MLAPVFRTIGTSAVKAIVGDRIYGSGNAPQNTERAYITWFTVVGQPYDQISGAPDGDNDAVQIDCWTGPADDQERVCIDLATAVRDALDAAGISNRLVLHQREADTKLFHIGLQADFIHSR